MILKQQYHVGQLGTGWVGSDWGFGDEQATPYMGRCMPCRAWVSAWHHEWVHGKFLRISRNGPYRLEQIYENDTKMVQIRVIFIVFVKNSI